MKPNIFHLKTDAEIDAAIATLSSRNQPGRVALLRRARAGDLAVLELSRGLAAPMRLLKRERGPLLVLLGDDDYQSSGPNGWVAVPKLLRWARGAMVHGTGGDTASYELGISMAIAARRFLLVETSSTMTPVWAERLSAARPRVPFIGLVPPDGAHPVLPSRSEMQ